MLTSGVIAGCIWLLFNPGFTRAAVGRGWAPGIATFLSVLAGLAIAAVVFAMLRHARKPGVRTYNKNYPPPPETDKVVIATSLTFAVVGASIAVWLTVRSGNASETGAFILVDAFVGALVGFAASIPVSLLLVGFLAITRRL